ncbi:Protein PSK SIMULATOR 1 [Linum perenne]
MVADSWLASVIRHSRKSAPESEQAIIGVLSFEVSKLMAKVVNLWHFLSDTETRTLRDDVVNTIGVQMLVSDDGDYLMELALNEILQNFSEVSVSVANLAAKCVDPQFQRFNRFVAAPVQSHLEWYGWEYRPRKMERKVKKMERFVGVMAVLAQELDVLAELERSRRRMMSNPKTDPIKLLESQQRVLWHQSEIRNLRAVSPWIRSYDYTVRLLVRSLLTILERIKIVCQVNQIVFNRKSHSRGPNLTRSRSMSSITVHPSPDLTSPALKKCKFRAKRDQIKSPMAPPRGCRHHIRSSRTRRLSDVGALTGCMATRDRDRQQSQDPSSPQPNFAAMGVSLRHPQTTMKKLGDDEEEEDKIEESMSCSRVIYSKLAVNSGTKRRLVNPAPSTLGDAGLYLHYANLIVVVEKMVSAVNEIDEESRENLYGMLPWSVRSVVRKRLRDQGRCGASSGGYDAATAAVWRHTVGRVLEWMLPLAHNMLRWQAVRNFEREQVQEADSKTHVLLVQTLYYADRPKTEAAIVELVIGLDYLYRIGKRLDEISS